MQSSAGAQGPRLRRGPKSDHRFRHEVEWLPCPARERAVRAETRCFRHDRYAGYHRGEECDSASPHRVRGRWRPGCVRPCHKPESSRRQRHRRREHRFRSCRKRLETLKELLPGLALVGVLLEPRQRCRSCNGERASAPRADGPAADPCGSGRRMRTRLRSLKRRRPE